MIKYEIQLQITSVFNCTELEPGDSLKMIKSTLHGTDNGFNFIVIEEYESKEAAVKSFKKYNGYKVYDMLDKRYHNDINYNYAVDYFLEENEYDEDGIWLKSVETISYAPLVEISDFDFYKMDIYKKWAKRVKYESQDRNLAGSWRNPKYRDQI